MGRWVFYAFVLMVLLIVLSRSTAFKTTFTALTGGTSTLARTFMGQNTAGTQFINGVSN